MRRLSMAALGVAFMSMATVPTLPAEAALLDFESDSVLGLLAIGVVGAALLLKRSVTHLG